MPCPTRDAPVTLLADSQQSLGDRSISGTRLRLLPRYVPPDRPALSSTRGRGKETPVSRPVHTGAPLPDLVFPARDCSYRFQSPHGWSADNRVSASYPSKRSSPALRPAFSPWPCPPRVPA